MPELPRCNQEVYEHGTVVFVTHSIPSAKLEEWVQKVAKLSQQPVDWHFVGGRAVIKALGDLGKVMQAMTELLPEHDAAFIASFKESLGENPSSEYIPRPGNLPYLLGT